MGASVYLRTAKHEMAHLGVVEEGMDAQGDLSALLRFAVIAACKADRSEYYPDKIATTAVRLRWGPHPSYSGSLVLVGVTTDVDRYRERSSGGRPPLVVSMKRTSLGDWTVDVKRRKGK